jgi:predicted nucleic acid-binding protein
VLASAVAGQADLLVTGDKDLLDIAEASLPIVTPRECREQLLTARGTKKK